MRFLVNYLSIKEGLILSFICLVAGPCESFARNYTGASQNHGHEDTVTKSLMKVEKNSNNVSTVVSIPTKVLVAYGVTLLSK